LRNFLDGGDAAARRFITDAMEPEIELAADPAFQDTFADCMAFTPYRLG